MVNKYVNIQIFRNNDNTEYYANILFCKELVTEK